MKLMREEYQRILDALGSDEDSMVELIQIIDDLGFLEAVLVYLGLNDEEVQETE